MTVLDPAAIESDDELALDTSSDDLRSTLASAFAEVSERARDEQGRFAASEQQAAAAQASMPATAAPSAQAETGAASAQAANPLTTDKPGDAAAQAAAATALTPEQRAAAQAAQAATAIKPPDSWSPVAKSKFAALDPEIQAEIARRESEVHKGFTKQDEHRNLGKTFEQAMTPYLPMIRAEGSDPVKAAQSLFQTAYLLRAGTQQQKVQATADLIRQFGIDPNGVFQSLQGAQQAQQVDPQVAQLQQQLAQLQQRFTQGDQQSEQAQAAQVQAAYERFASDPKHIYFANVKPDMAALLGNGRAKTFEEAYEMACWARPDIRPLLQQQVDLQRRTDTQTRTQRARAAGSTLTGSPTGAVSAASIAPADRDLRSELAANFREVMSRE